ncbi:MAG: sigma-70 family RNA polymerase sigma factor [Planctomycetes bacterium]|nr:sigma-70 family RNA polymerase sigma factor [Planctomycetota bacterium]MCB9903305.1 sigma-70 family RNA polymerase sigma factor [Planctomycetota bacterium]
MSTSGQAHFHTTRWSLVRSAGRGDEAARASLEELCRDYWYPLYAFARRSGRSREAAEDTIQSFFTRLLERDDFATADPERGRFRAFLAGALRHHMANEHRRANAEKRGGSHVTIAIDWADADVRFERDLAAERSPADLFERDWAFTVLDGALERLRAELLERERGALFELVAAELGGGVARESRADQAARLGMTEGALKTAVSRARARFRELLRDAVADTLSDPAEADEELLRLFDALG